MRGMLVATIRIRIAEVDNMDPLWGAMDAVSISDVPPTIPTLNEWGMIISACLLSLAGLTFQNLVFFML